MDFAQLILPSKKKNQKLEMSISGKGGVYAIGS